MFPEAFHPAALLAADPQALMIPLSMLVIFGAAKLLAELLERMNQPGIVGEILAGVLFCPSVLAWVAPNELTTSFADLGVMFLLFGVGLETDPKELRGLGGTATVVAACGVVVPFAMGWGILTLWGAPPMEALFVGAALVATSVGITARVLHKKGVLRERASQIILAAAVVDDVLGLLVLAVVSSMASGEVRLLEIALTAALAVAFVLIVVMWGDKAMGHVVPRVQRNLQSSEAEFSFSMILLFALAVLAVYVGIAAIVGAFFAGMALAGKVGQRVHDLVHGATELMVPFFLAGIGLHVSLASFGSAPMIGLSLLILAAAIVSKFLGCGLGALPLGRIAAMKIGVGMIPRGEVGMVVAQIGLSIGVLSADIYAVVVFMAVATTLVAPPLLSMVYRDPPGVAPDEANLAKAGSH
jgi:Kef-type K+ transport system membrane component KefB